MNKSSIISAWMFGLISCLLKTHIEKLTRKLRIKIDFYKRNQSCLTLESRRKIVQATLLPVLDYGDIIYMHAAASALKPLDSVYYSALCFITGYHFCVHHCILYSSVGWESLTTRRAQYCSHINWRSST